MMKKYVSGFTLIELLITVVIIGILAAFAIPSYSKYVRRSARSQAQAQMLNLAQMEERYYSNSAGSTTAPGYYAMSAAPTTEPNGWPNYSGGSSMTARKYAIGITVSGSTYTITATPSNGYSEPDCGSLTLDSTGAKGSQYHTITCW